MEQLPVCAEREERTAEVRGTNCRSASRENNDDAHLKPRHSQLKNFPILAFDHEIVNQLLLILLPYLDKVLDILAQQSAFQHSYAKLAYELL